MWVDNLGISMKPLVVLFCEIRLDGAPSGMRLDLWECLRHQNKTNKKSAFLLCSSTYIHTCLMYVCVR